MDLYLGNKKMEIMMNGKKYKFEDTSLDKIHYVSLGDSIAAGHTINEDWETDYGEGSQYGKNGNTSTVIVPGCYTDLIKNELVSRYSKKYVLAKSFARSGDTVQDLINKLSHDIVRNAIAKANYVTICIGANDVLQPAMSHLDEYIEYGDLSVLENIVNANLAVLNDNNSATSYMSLFNKLYEINPNAQYIFTTIYNPYKYLWIEEGNNGFFGPLLSTIPNIDILGLDIDSLIKNGLLSTSIVQLLFNRVNGLNSWAEKYVTSLNQVLRNKINEYHNTHPGFILADSKAVFDPVPDRPISAVKHYNDLVSVEYTRGYDTMTMDWGRLWGDNSVASFWIDLATKYVSLSGLDINGFASELVEQIINKVIIPDVDPHPETYGQYALSRSFIDALGWSLLPRRTITYNANGGIGSMSTKEIVALDNMVAYANIDTNTFTPSSEGYYFTGWNTAANGSGTSYLNGQFIGLSENITLYAQWSDVYTISYRKRSNNEYVSPSGVTGPVTKDGSPYYLRTTLGGTVIDGLSDQFNSNGESQNRTTYAKYNTELYIQLINTGSYDRGAVYVNGSKVAGNSEYCYYTMPVKSHMNIEFVWEYEQGWNGIIPESQSYWICYITTY